MTRQQRRQRRHDKPTAAETASVILPYVARLGKDPEYLEWLGAQIEPYVETGAALPADVQDRIANEILRRVELLQAQDRSAAES